jgi:hypothetical protein
MQGLAHHAGGVDAIAEGEYDLEKEERADARLLLSSRE